MNEHLTSRRVLRGFDSIQAIYNQTVLNLRPIGFIGGSYAAFMVARDNPILPNDVDIFATSAENALLIRDGIMQLGPYNGMGYEESAVAYSITPCSYDMEHIKHPVLGVQIIKPHPDWRVFPEDIIESFDFDISRAVLQAPNWVLADENVGFRRGKILKTHDPLRSLKRAMKYNARGAEFSDHELLKLFRAWESMPSEKREKMLADALQAEQPEEIVSSDGWNYDEDDYFDGE